MLHIILCLYRVYMYFHRRSYVRTIELHTYMYHVRFGFQPENGMRKIGQRENRNTKTLRNGE